jgi:hypothetical protein
LQVPNVNQITEIRVNHSKSGTPMVSTAESNAGFRSDIWTAAALGAMAYIADDLTHEALGHGVMSLLVTGATPVSLSTVGLSTTGSSRLVALAGPLLNLLVGSTGAYIFKKRGGFGPGSYFLWLFTALNLFNGFGYAMYSSILNFGDLTVVTARWEPQWLYRLLLVVVGALGYFLGLRLACRTLADRLTLMNVPRSDVVRLTLPAYLTGGTLFLAGAALNPIRSLVLLSGVSSGFFCMFGLLLIPAYATKLMPASGTNTALTRSWVYIVAALGLSAIFVLVLGPGIRLQ